MIRFLVMDLCLTTHEVRPPGMMEAHPAIVLAPDLSDRVVHIIEERFDVVTRTVSGANRAMMRSSLGRFGGRLVASPVYLERRGCPVVPGDWRTMPAGGSDRLQRANFGSGPSSRRSGTDVSTTRMR